MYNTWGHRYKSEPFFLRSAKRGIEYVYKLTRKETGAGSTFSKLLCYRSFGRVQKLRKGVQGLF